MALASAGKILLETTTFFDVVIPQLMYESGCSRSRQYADTKFEIPKRMFLAKSATSGSICGMSKDSFTIAESRNRISKAVLRFAADFGLVIRTGPTWRFAADSFVKVLTSINLPV